jgi:hypothetical protein
MEAIFGLFANYEQARAAIELLVEHRFRPENMNLLISESAVKDRFRGWLDLANALATELPPGLDRLLAGKQPLNIHDAGNIHAAGDEAVILAKTASIAESRSEGLVSTLVAFGLPKEVAEESRNTISGGGALFWLKTEETRTADAANILRDHEARHVASFAREGLRV